MEFLNFLLHAFDQMSESTLIIFFACLGALIVYPFAIRDRKKALKMVEKSLKMQEDTNRHLIAAVQELKRSHRMLCILADVEPEEVNYSQYGQQGSGQQGSQSADVGSNAGSNAGSLDVTSQTKLYVGNIDYAATEAELADHFARFGRIEFVNIPINRYNGRARGFGFVTFTSIQEAERAMALNGSEFRGRQIQVNFAKERD